MESGDFPNSVKEARERFDLFSDASLASRLQDQEFGAHFNANRQERRLVGSDTKVSREEQMMEMQRQAALRREHLSRVAETDEQIARRLQEEFNREEEVKRFLAMKQAEHDARIARELQEQEQGRIVGYGPSASPSTSAVSASTSTRASTDPHHIYAAQNNLNEHYADRVSSSLIDLSAEDALTTLTSPPAFVTSTNPDPFLSNMESRASTYAPSGAVPLLPPPPEFVVRREQERVMGELSRLQPRLALAGLAEGDVGVAGVAAARVSPPPAYPSPPRHAPSRVAAPLYSSPAPSTPAHSYSSPPSEATPTSFYPHLPTAAAPVVTSPTPTGVTLAATNPFLIDLIGEERETNAPSGGGHYFSEFGLPPPSSLATGDQRGSYSLI
ncbi:hypothetical protein PMAYCL1PPCAC_06429 [Pristionchus mayeri]|uniref:Coiled-coil domain-containing protein n=1 Tax=Pristionchus mayeri TaxID=1317129 RepID=A0AAN4ZA97_9BILA|nr:hypothetical protein PMAYCL1PPCAC_06429 [Pristionchus mayeri]